MKRLIVPNQYALPPIWEYLNKQGYQDYVLQQLEEGGVKDGRLNPADALADQAHVDRSHFRQLINGRKRGIDFYTLDRIFCAMGNPIGCWDSWPLIVFYWAANLNAPPQGKHVCLNKECRAEFKIEDGVGYRNAYCSEECRERLVTRSCKGCSASFETRSNSRQQYCTVLCRDSTRARREVVAA